MATWCCVACRSGRWELQPGRWWSSHQESPASPRKCIAVSPEIVSGNGGKMVRVNLSKISRLCSPPSAVWGRPRGGGRTRGRGRRATHPSYLAAGRWSTGRISWLVERDELTLSFFRAEKRDNSSFLDPEIHVQWWHFLRQVIIVDFWWCFIQKYGQFII